MWGEYVDATVLMPRTFPRASVVAERLWSPQTLTNTTWMAERLEEHRCRMLSRGLPVGPLNGPGYCEVEWGQGVATSLADQSTLMEHSGLPLELEHTWHDPRASWAEVHGYNQVYPRKIRLSGTRTFTPLLKPNQFSLGHL